jgi:hypothetical protein
VPGHASAQNSNKRSISVLHKPDKLISYRQETGWFRDFPPQGVEVVSWYVMMGIGQVVTLRFPAERLREINRLVESEAWGGYRTEFYPTYDYRSLYAQLQAKMR